LLHNSLSFVNYLFAAETEPHEGKRKVEALWPIFKIHHQKSRYIYDLFYRRKAISRGGLCCVSVRSRTVQRYKVCLYLIPKILIAVIRSLCGRFVSCKLIVVRVGILGNQKVCYRDHKHSLLYSVPNEMYLVHALASSFFKSISLLSTHLLVSYQTGVFPSGFSSKRLCQFCFSSIPASCPMHLICYVLQNCMNIVCERT